MGYNRDRDSADQFVADMLTKTRHHGASASHTGATSARREIAAARSQEVIDEHGRLVDVLSVVAETGNIGQANYAASKSGLFGLTKTLEGGRLPAGEVRQEHRRRNRHHRQHRHTGLITTEMTADIPEKVLAKLTNQIPVGRAGRPEEVVHVVCFLAPTHPPTSPARSGASTAAWTCEREKHSRPRPTSAALS